MAWSSMKTRCYNPRSKRFDRYGGRGIGVCERWRNSFAAFLADMGPRPGPGYSLDRYPDKDGDYEPGNCRWATQTEQNNNRSGNVLLVVNGVSRTLAEWSRIGGVPRHVIAGRIQNGWCPARAVLVPAGPSGHGDVCRRGHPRTERNTRVDDRGRRSCRPCGSMRNSAYYARRRTS